MQLGRYGSIAGVCLGPSAAGAGMIAPNDPLIGWGLISAGALIFVISTFWLIISFFRKAQTEPTTTASSSSIGNISVHAGDGNKIGDIGHRVNSRDG